MKSANGDGTVIKLDGKRKKPYAAIITTGSIQIYNDEGEPIGRAKQKRKYLGYYKSKPEAQSALIEYRKKHPAYTDQPSNVEPSQIKEKQPVFVPTFEQMWKQTYNLHKSEWARETERNHVKESVICEPLNHYRIDELNYQILQKFMNDYAKTGKTIGMLRLLKNHISFVCNDAIKFGYISANPISLVSLKATEETHEKEALSPELIRKIESSNCKTRNTLLILIYSGMRLNELLNMKPEDIHLDLGYMIGGEKTETSKNRIIPIHPYIMPLVKEWKAKPDFKTDSTFAWYLYRELETYGAKFSSHYCRHTFASLADDYHLSVYATKSIMGHAIPKSDVTGSVYIHKDPEKLIEEIKKIPYPDKL